MGEALRARAFRRSDHVLQPRSGLERRISSTCSSPAKARAARPAVSAAAADATERDRAAAAVRCSACGAAGAVRLSRAAGRSPGCCPMIARTPVSPLRGRRHHRSGPVGPGAEEDRRQLSRHRQLLRGHDLQRLDRREALGEPLQGEAHAGERSASSTCTARSTYSAGYIHSASRTTSPNTTYFGQPGHVRRPDHRVPELQARLGQGVPRPQGRRRPDRQRSAFGGFDKNGNPISFKDADHRGYAVGLSQILTRNLIASFNYEVLTDQGYLQSPYRKILFLDPTAGNGFTLGGPDLSQHPHQQRGLRCSSNTTCRTAPRSRASTATSRTPGASARHTARARLHASGCKHWIFDGSCASTRRMRRLLQRPVSARQLPEFHGARPRAGGIQQLHRRRRRLLRVPRFRARRGSTEAASTCDSITC